MAKKKAAKVKMSKQAEIASGLAKPVAPVEVSPAQAIVNSVLRPGNEVTILGTGAVPIEQHPRYPELASFAQQLTGLYLNSLNLSGRSLGMNIGLKIFIKAEDIPNGNISTT